MQIQPRGIVGSSAGRTNGSRYSFTSFNMDRDTSRTRVSGGGVDEIGKGPRGRHIGGGKARKDGASFERVWMSRRRLGYSRELDGRLGQIQSDVATAAMRAPSRR